MSERSERGLLLSILSPERLVYRGWVEWAQIPLVDGLLGVWPGHAPLVAHVGPGTLELGTEAATYAVELGGGILHIDEHGCTLLLGAHPDGEEGEAVDLESLARQLESALAASLTEQELADLQQAV
jgi:F-type H+-transporting ATPase subunit epsilon